MYVLLLSVIIWLQLVPDDLSVFIELEGSELQMTGLLIRFILDLKNNYFGFYDSVGG